MKWNVLPSHVSLTLTDAAFRVIEIPILPAVLGRKGKNADIVVEHPSICFEHALLHAENGPLAVRELGSRNGTFVNGKRVESESILKNGDEFTLGAVNFRVGLIIGGEPRPKVRKEPEDRLAMTVPAPAPAASRHAHEAEGHVRPIFLIVDNNGKRREFLLNKPVSTVGRHDGDIRISDPSLSRKHFQVEIYADHVCIKDLASANGTYVNGRPISYFRALDAVTFTAGASTFQLVTGPRVK